MYKQDFLKKILLKVAYFVRHAKSSWKNLDISDHDRALNARGKRDAPLMAAKFKEQERCVPLLISSSAKRAFKTALYFARHLELDKKEVVIEPSLYHGSEDDFASVLFSQSDSLNTIMIFAHNPGLTYFANHYSDFSIDNVPTTGIFKLESKSDKWVDFFSNVRLSSFIYPKMFIH